MLLRLRLAPLARRWVPAILEWGSFVDFSSEPYVKAINTLHPQVRNFLDTLAAQNRPGWETMPPAEGRALFSSFKALFGVGPELHRVEDRNIAGEVPVRIYWPSDEDNLAVVIYFHGGGWVLGNVNTHDPLCRRLASEAGCVVVSVDYRLAPDAKFPAAFDDCFAATAYVSQHADEFNVDPLRLVVAGDSAGGNLATAVAIRATEVGSPAICSQVLIYPVVEPTFDTESYLAHATDSVVLDNKNCRFEPHVVPLWTTQTLVIKNSDPVGHNTNGSTFANTAFNVIIPSGGQIEQKLAQPERLPAKAACSIHPWMTSWLVVQDNPYIGVSDKDGVLELKNLPQGEWTIQFWQEAAGYVQDVKVNGKATEWKRGRVDVKIENGKATDLGSVQFAPKP